MSHPEDGLSREQSETQVGNRENPEANMPRAEKVKQWFGSLRQGVRNKFGRFQYRREVAENIMGDVPMTEGSQAHLANIETRAEQTASAGDKRLEEIEAAVEPGPNDFEREFGDEAYYRDVMLGERLHFPFSSGRSGYGYDTGPAPENIRQAESEFYNGMEGVREAIFNPKILEASARQAMVQEQRDKAQASLKELQATAAAEGAGSEIYDRVQDDLGRDAMAGRMVEALRHVDGDRKDPSWVNSVRAEEKLKSIHVPKAVEGAMGELGTTREENPEQYARELFARLEEMFDKTAQAAAEYVVSNGHSGRNLNEIQGGMQEFIAKNREIVQGYMFPLKRHNKLSPQQTDKYLQCAGEVKFLMDAYRELTSASHKQIMDRAIRKK